MEYLNALQNGFGIDFWTLFMNRMVLGSFFAISGYHKLFNKQRHAALVGTLVKSKVPLIGFNQWFVPSVEFLGGLSLLSGILAPLAAFGLMVICTVAVCTDGLKRVSGEQPIDKADWLDDALYLPELLYIVGLSIVIDYGSGPYTVLALF